MGIKKFRLSKQWWDSMSDGAQETIIKSLKKASILGPQDEVVPSDELQPPKIRRQFSTMSRRGKSLGQTCEERCEMTAACVEEKCLERGGDPDDCLEAALDAYECCAEFCEEEGPNPA